MGTPLQVLLPFRVVTLSFVQKGLLTYRRVKGNQFLIRCLCELTLTLRYINVDYAVASTLADDVKAGLADAVVTYDIGCQWGKKLSQRLSNYAFAPSLKVGSLNSFRVAVPKFHIVGHGASCQATFNLAYMNGVGMTHGESVETIWSHSTSLATWSRENGPGARHLILDDHWNGWNWQKYTGLRKFPRSGLSMIRLTPTQATS